MVGRRALIVLAGIAACGVARPAAACAPVTIFFDWNSARIAPDSRAALERLATSLAWKGPDVDYLLITAHTDRSGSDRANRLIASRRAAAVRAMLIGYDVPAKSIRIGIAGEDRLRVPTPDEVRERYNRRVELLVQLSAAGQARQLRAGRPIC
jgi:OmpA-OmpF porin, OOP family